MLLTSNRRVTLGELVLLDWDDLTQEESELLRNFIPRQADRLGAAFSQQLSGSNVAHTISFARVKRCASHDLARSLKFALAAALPIEPALLTIELHRAGGEVWTMAETMLQPGFTIRAEAELLKASYTLIGGQLTQTVAPEWLTTEGGEALTTEGGEVLTPEA